MKAVVLDLNGKPVGEVELPPQFSEEYAPDLIKRAFYAEFTARLQPKGVFPLAGMQTSARYYGRRHSWRQIINTGRSRLPRQKIPGYGTGKVRMVPHSAGGRRAHPPKPEKILVEKINFKERCKAIRSALAASANLDLIRKRGHLFAGDVPIIINSSFEETKRVKDAERVLKAVGVGADLQRARNARRKRSGRARLRKGGYREPKSVLIVFGEDKGIWRATRNLPGVSAMRVDELLVEELAPGGEAGRLTVFTQNALSKLAGNKLYL